jgi:hypothetical protein
MTHDSVGTEVSVPTLALYPEFHSNPCETAPQPIQRAKDPNPIASTRKRKRSLIGCFPILGTHSSGYYERMHQNHSRLMQEATQPAPKPLSMLTTVTFDAQLFNMPSSAATPPKLAP